MSTRASIRAGERPSAFVWASTGPDVAAPPPLQPFRAPELQRTAAPPPPAPPAAPAPDAAEQQARLAALERDAFAKGYAQGERAGTEAGTRRSEAMLRRLGETLDEIAGLRERIVRQSERQLVELALALARRIVHREVARDDEFLMALARVAVDRLGESSGATIHLHPEDFARTPARQIEEWSKSHVKIIADASIARGGCRVESPFGFVDAGVDAQFQELARALLDTDVAGLELHGV
jgi:flagellar assembly protein FliH